MNKKVLPGLFCRDEAEQQLGPVFQGSRNPGRSIYRFRIFGPRGVYLQVRMLEL